MDEAARDLTAALAARLRAALAEDPETKAAQAGLDERIALEIGDRTLGLAPGADGYGLVEPAGAGSTLRLRAPPAVWEAAMAPVPPPGRQSLSAMLRSGDLVATGEPLALPRALHLLERLLEVVRGTAPAAPAPEVARDLRQLEGRYHRLAKAGGAFATVYGEAAGAGLPVVFLHTAGADSRQYQAQLADVELARRFRLHAFDLPLHGRSLPPDGWDGGRFKLRQADYAAWCVAYLEQVVQERAVVVGCSMGAAMSLVLAALRPDLVRGVVALEAPFRARGRLSPALAHAGVNSATHNPSYVRGLMGPRTSAAARRAATWIYGQGGFGVYAGDLAFYSEEFDGGATAPLIDAARCPVAFLSGAYDYSASPADAQRLAALIPGATLQVMPELGHFPMIEAPDVFRVHFLPALQRVSGQGET